MPLPALPDSTTARYRLVYTADGITHRIQAHRPLQDTSAASITDATALANLLKVLVPTNVIFTGVEWADIGSNVFNLVATLNIAGTVATALTVADHPRFGSFVGRSNDGRKVRMLVFGVSGGADNTWRFTRQEYAAVGTVVDGLNTGTGNVRTISSGTPVWKNYMNLGYHDRYIRKARQ